MEVNVLQAPSADPITPVRWKVALGRQATLAAWCAIGLLLGLSFVSGLAIRRAVWDITAPIRFGDIRNGFYWGMQASGTQGYLNQYEKMANEQSDWGRWLDYAPLRLLVMDTWGHWVRWEYPRPDESQQDREWSPDYAFNRPVLDFNTGMDALGAVCAFFLTRLWVRRTHAGNVAQFTGVLPGLVAALTLWFNPAMLMSAYGWPTWDAWIVPMYLLAALLASAEWWFCAGLAIAVGAMFKGQQLTVAPVFVLWSLMIGQLGSAARWCAGLLFGMGLIASPWLFSYLMPESLHALQDGMPYHNDPNSPAALAAHRVIEFPAICWVVGVVAAIVIASHLANRRKRLVEKEETHWHLFALLSAMLALIFIATIWPWLLERNHHTLWLGAILSVTLATAAVWLPRTARPALIAGAGGAAALLCIFVFHGSHAWWDCGFHFGTVHWQTMVMGHTDNIPGLLDIRYKWPDSALAHLLTIDPLPGAWPIFVRMRIWPAVPLDLSTKQLFDSIYIVFLLISGVGLGLQARRRDPRFLAALITPWVLFFTIPVQIHERYLLFAAGAAGICIGQSVGTYLLGLFLSLITLFMTLHVMMIAGADVGDFGTRLSMLLPWLFSPDSGHTIYKYIDGTFPDAAWGIIVAAGAFLYLSFSPTPGRKLLRSDLAD